MTDDRVNQLTGYRSNHKLLVRWVPWVRLRIPRFKSVSGGNGSLCHLGGHVARLGLGVGLIIEAGSGRGRGGLAGQVMEGLHWLQRLLLGHRAPAHLLGGGALVIQRRVVA